MAPRWRSFPARRGVGVLVLHRGEPDATLDPGPTAHGMLSLLDVPLRLRGGER